MNRTGHYLDRRCAGAPDKGRLLEVLVEHYDALDRLVTLDATDLDRELPGRAPDERSNTRRRTLDPPGEARSSTRRTASGVARTAPGRPHS